MASKNPRVSALVARFGSRSLRSPKAIIRRLAERTLKEASFRHEPPPVDPVAVARARGISAVQEVDNIPADAVLKRVDGNLVICVSRRAPRVRRNFSILHEVGHTFFAEAARDLPLLNEAQQEGLRKHYGEEERLCDLAAVELLLPRSAFGNALRQVEELDWKAIRGLAERFQASAEATLRRIGEVSRASLSVERWTETPDNEWQYQTLVCSRDLRQLLAASDRTLSRALLHRALAERSLLPHALTIPGRPTRYRAEVVWIRKDHGRRQLITLLSGARSQGS